MQIVLCSLHNAICIMCFVSFKILMLNGCQSVTFILVKAGKFSKAKDTTMLSLAIFVDVRLRETVVIFKFFTKGCCNVG